MLALAAHWNTEKISTGMTDSSMERYVFSPVEEEAERVLEREGMEGPRERPPTIKERRDV